VLTAAYAAHPERFVAGVPRIDLADELIEVLAEVKAQRPALAVKRASTACFPGTLPARSMVMDLDIQTEHVAMRPEWHCAIDGWPERCARHYPQVTSIDLILRHGESRERTDKEVDVEATASGRTLRAAKHATVMSEALYEAPNAVEQEILLHETSAIAPEQGRRRASATIPDHGTTDGTHLPVWGVLKNGMNPKQVASGRSMRPDHFPFAATVPQATSGPLVNTMPQV
jgi:ribosome-associated translation inhibitor RaiA